MELSVQKKTIIFSKPKQLGSIRNLGLIAFQPLSQKDSGSVIFCMKIQTDHLEIRQVRSFWSKSGNVRVLLVEDNERLAEAVSKGLREQSFAVDLAFDGENALYQAEINDYDLIVLDIMIPAPDGFAVCRELRRKDNPTPILMLTARDSTEDKIRGLDTGADDYLTKPFKFGEMMARIRALLRRSTSELSPTKLKVADLTININAQRVWRGGREIVLTTKEYAMLEFLVRRKGNVLGRAEIAEHCWDENFEVFSNTIDVYINHLRAKIDNDFDVKLIHTRRGAGYILDDDV